MPNDLLKHQIEAALKNFSAGTLAENATALFHALGYRSNKGLTLAPNTAETFRAEFDRAGIFDADAACVQEWRAVDLVFQLTDDEINAGAQRRLFESRAVNPREPNSYLVFCIHLSEPHYSRTQLANITRAVNKLFPMPALILFQHGETLTLAVIDRRAHKRDADKDVLEKVTLIKDIRVVEPHRAHVEILFDLALSTLAAVHAPANWGELHDCWRRVLDTSELNKKFFKELANWYFWAQQRVVFPKPASNTDKDDVWRAMNVIRLITRLMFVWFIKEKSLVPDDLFDERRVKKLLKSLAGKESTYYKAILQNLFFGTLNTEMRDKDGKPNRKFIKRSSQFHNPQHLVHNVYRYHDAFADADAFLNLCADIPFLNGGLFECLDVSTTERVDGFSEHEKNPLRVPNELFFADWHTEDLSAAYGSPKTDKVRGLLEILSHYKFTVDENTPIEEEIALDPELLGKVFENLLAAYNPETGVTARKQTGSFYTPREIVNYMVDEALVAYLEQNLRGLRDLEGLDARLRHLLSYTAEPPQFSDAEKRALVNAIDNLKVLDPACGSGAFPLGVLHKLVHILRKLDPGNLIWKEKQIANAYGFGMDSALDVSLAEIERTFERNEDDYARKLYLIQNCIYGVDIQPIAAQIAKLRCFISLIVDETLDDTKENRGIIPLPNLETKFVAANTLIGIDRPRAADVIASGRSLSDEAISTELEQKCNDLADILRQYLKVKNPATQKKYLELGEALGAEINAALAGRVGFEPLNINWLFTTATSVDALLERLPIQKQAQAKALTLRRDDIKEKEKQLEQVRRAMFGARTFNKKKQFREQDARLRAEIADLLKKDGMGDATAAQLAAWDPYDQNKSAPFFDADWMFGVEEGFDVVIGNPPYGAEMETSDVTLLDKKFAKYKSATKNSAMYFTYLADEMLKPNGTNTFIVPKSICYSMGWNKCAAFIAQDLTRIVDIGKAFEKVKLEQIVFVRPRTSQTSSFVNGLFENKTISELGAVSKTIFETYKVLLAGQTKEEIEIIHKILGNLKHTFGEYVSIERGLNWQSQVAKHRGKTPVYRGAHLDKYVLNDATDFVSLNSFSKEEYGYQLKPKILNQLAVAHVQNPYPHFYLQAALDEDGSKIVFETISCTFARSSNLNIKFVLGINNSRLFEWLLYKFIYSNAIRSTRYDAEYVSRIPVPQFEQTNQQPIIHLVDRILAAKRADVRADTTAWEREIDELVYQLYGLNDDEIAIVEGRGRLDHESRER